MVQDAPLRKVVPLMRLIWLVRADNCQLSGKKPINNEVAEKLLLDPQEMGQGQALAAWLSGVPAIS